MISAEERERRERLERLRAEGVNPFPARVERTHTIEALIAAFEALQADGAVVTIVGRVMAKRRHGRLAFLRLEDGHGAIQVLCRVDAMGDAAFDLLMQTLDVGDFVEAAGTATRTRTGEASLGAQTVRIIAKALRPLPEKWHGLSDTEMRFRQRELDLIANPSVRRIFQDRANIITTMRAFFDARGFLEVDTPILQHVAAGAAARPFITHHHALDEEFYLRIAPELYLKRCVIGGFERVYEIARCFRNEGIDHTHSPEFSQLEAYAAYMDYEELMGLMEELLRDVLKALGRDPSAVAFDAYTLDFQTPFVRKTFRELLFEATGIDTDTIHRVEEARIAAERVGISYEERDSLATLLDQLWKKTVRPTIVQPTFVIDYPASITPLAKRREDDPERLEMFQLVLGGGFEVMKAFSELNDPVDQEARMQEQEEAHVAGDEDAQRKDDDFLRAMLHGMPPMAGVGIGIERLTQVLTNSHNIKDVLLFPTLKSEERLDT